MSSSNMAFSTFLPTASSPFRTSPIVVRKSPATAPPTAAFTIHAVLDTPASNTHLQRTAEVVVRDYLTRRAVNTVLYYMHELHDSPSHQWLSKFDDFAERAKSHSFKDGDSFLDRMKRTAPENCTLRIGHPSGRFSRTLKFTIEPHRIAARIVSVRVQLAEEWAKDLRLMESENLELQRLSFERYLVKSEAELDSKRNLIFDTDPFANDQTPLRWKNYVGLKTLSTQHAVARLLPYMRDQGSNHEYMYLLQFVKSYGPIGDGDEFLRVLMAKEVETRTNPTFTVVPRAIAVQVMDVRKAVADEWMSVMEFVPVEHELNVRGALEKSMSKSIDLPEDGFQSPPPPANGH